MIRLLLFNCLLFLTLLSNANTILVKNIDELKAANKQALPGDIIILWNGEWKNVTISLNCAGTKGSPITFRAQTAGKVLITGNSKLQIGGNYIIIEGLYFTNGYSGGDDVISFRIDNKQLANNCRVTNTTINNFNNLKRMDENYWVTFYGKNNRLDHCSFLDKKNMGVLLAVVLEDERSRENFHSIDHNYFGRRPPLASNGGEIIRVGVSQYCQFNSNTQIKNNFFEQCDGETEIISIKSCSNIVEGNVFKECQGSVVLRHGDNNLVSANYFLGNDKPGSGGVRVINKGQKVQNNFFYKCRGADFRSPLAIMNGIPNSPANRYVQVTNAEITDNSFYECAAITLCEGSDAERTLPPDNSILARNKFYNTRDSLVYKVYDDIKGIRFSDNKVSNVVSQDVTGGFDKAVLSKPAYPSQIEKETFKNSGAGWFIKHSLAGSQSLLAVNCATPGEVYKQLEKKEPLIIRLTGKEYSVGKPFVVTKEVQFTSDKKEPIKFISGNLLSVFIVSGKGNLVLNRLVIDGENVRASNFICSDSSGYAEHYNLTIDNCSFQKLNKEAGCQNFFYAFKHMIADSIVIRNNAFINNSCNFFMMSEEREDKGYYNAEKIFIGHNSFSSQTGTMLDIYRGGNDESTLGPDLTFSHNRLSNCVSSGTNPLLSLTGIQVTNIFSNNFSASNPASTLILYKDTVRARHSFEKNILSNSGSLEKDQYVTEKNNTIK